MTDNEILDTIDPSWADDGDDYEAKRDQRYLDDYDFLTLPPEYFGEDA